MSEFIAKLRLLGNFPSQPKENLTLSNLNINFTTKANV